MVLKELVVENFGLYKGKYSFRLAPEISNEKNICLLVGQNGVGKSTVPEALQLCLSGSLTLGERVAPQEYEKYLLKRTHRNPDSNTHLKTSLEVSFDFVKAGSLHFFRVVRSWNSDPANINEELLLFEDGREIRELNQKEKNLYLKELIPPGYIKVIFFDGERLRSLNDNSELNSFVADCCQTLFGLSLVNLLQKDIEHYTNKLINEKSDDSNYLEFNEINKQIKSTLKSRDDFFAKDQSLLSKLEKLKLKAGSVEGNVAEKGRWVQEKVQSLDLKRNALENTLANEKKELVEIFNELGPFTVAQDISLKLGKRLKRETKIEKWKNAEEIIRDRVEEITGGLLESKAWGELKINVPINVKNKLIDEFKKNLLDFQSELPERKIIHELSTSERNSMLTWIDRITKDLPRRIHNLTDSISQNEAALTKVLKERASFSSEEAIKPLLDELQILHKQIGGLENERRNNQKKIDELDKRYAFYAARRDSVQKKVQIKDSIDRKLQLSSKVKSILLEYTERIKEKKLSKLEKALIEKFNMLCRKKNYFDSVFIDRKTFNITLYKGKQELSQEHLSAGEKQLLALSLLWSLHETTNVSLPLIIDTPLARLDQKHRYSILNTFLPFVSKQVIVLGTEIEISGEVLNQLSNHINILYELQYDNKKHATKVHERNPAEKLDLEVEV